MRKVRLKSVQTNGGFLERCRIDFSPQLTCIIGARGTCKSTVIESIRFAFNLGPEQIKRLLTSEQGKEGMIAKTLGAASVRCVVEVCDGNEAVEYTIDREIGTAPRVLRDGTRDLFADALLDEIEIFSQGDLQKIASEDKPHLRLGLIDRPNRAQIREKTREIAKRVVELKNLGDRLRALRGDIDRRRLEIRDIDQLRAQMGQAVQNRPQLPPTLEEQHSLFIQRRALLELLGELDLFQEEAVASLADFASRRGKISEFRSRAEQASGVDSPALLKLIDALDEAFTDVERNRLRLSNVPVSASTQKLASQFEAENEIYYQLRQQQQALNESLKREDLLRHRVQELEKTEREVRQLEAERDRLSRNRSTARATLTGLREEIFVMRVQEANRINQEFGDVILLTVKRAAHSRAFVGRLSELLAGSRIRTQGNIAEELATSLAPSDLMQVIEDGDSQRLATLLSRDLGQVSRVTTYLRDHPDLYDLEGLPYEDTLEITMFDQGQPKPVEELSLGQRATALLPLILRESDCPLVVDQPEDDLDNSFIYRVLVENVRKLKSERQLIFVTHNANIPVLGDAESVVVMHMRAATEAGPPLTGTLDDRKEEILQLLEGGKKAFEIREQRYGALLK